MDIVSVADLKVGMFVVEPDCPWTDLPFALQGFVIATPQQIEVFRSRCRFIQIDRSRSQGDQYAAVVRGRDAPLRPPVRSQSGGASIESQRTPARSLTFFGTDPHRQQRRQRFLDFLKHRDETEGGQALSSELARIEPHYESVQRALHGALENIDTEKNVDLGNLQAGLHDLAESLRRNPDALMWLVRLRQADRYSFDHALDVSVNVLLLATHLGWRGEALSEVGLAGLFQDVGKVELPLELLNKSEPLTPDEKELIRSHVASSLEILYGLGGLPFGVLQTISRHHERWDGSGYPRGLKMTQIGLAGEMSGLVDSYCAMLKTTPYRAAMGHQPALEELFRLRGTKFNPALIEQFVQCVGLYPVGTLVELSSGEVAVVIQQNRVQRSRPRLLLMLDPDKARIDDYRVVDLRDAAHRATRVLRALPQNAYGLMADDYYLG